MRQDPLQAAPAGLELQIPQDCRQAGQSEHHRGCKSAGRFGQDNSVAGWGTRLQEWWATRSRAPDSKGTAAPLQESRLRRALPLVGPELTLQPLVPRRGRPPDLRQMDTAVLGCTAPPVALHPVQHPRPLEQGGSLEVGQNSRRAPLLGLPLLDSPGLDRERWADRSPGGGWRP